MHALDKKGGFDKTCIRGIRVLDETIDHFWAAMPAHSDDGNNTIMAGSSEVSTVKYRPSFYHKVLFF